jgi:hypothetical protein
MGVVGTEEERDTQNDALVKEVYSVAALFANNRF